MAAGQSETKSMSSPGSRALPPWIFIFAAGLIVAVTIGLRQVVGLYLPPVTQSLDIGVEPFARAMAIANLLWGAGAIIAGGLADRFGAGRIIALGIALMMAGYYAMYLAQTGNDLVWSGVLIGMGVAGCGLGVMVGVIGRAVSEDQRTAALASLGMAAGLGNFIAFPYTHLLIEQFGWQGSILVVIATLGALLPCAVLLSGKPDTGPQAAIGQSVREALDEAFRLPSYLLLNIGFFVCGFHVAFYSVHLPAFVAKQGLQAWVAVAALTAVGVANIIGTYVAGQSAKYIEKRRGLSIIYLARCGIFLALLFVPVTIASIIGLSILLGLFWLATVPLTSGLVATFFGTKWLSLLFGFVLFSHQLGSFAGIWLAGIIFDRTQSYDLMWIICIALGLLAALLHWPIREQGVPRLKTKQG
jgi:predicted MFS family arabinose efflux permease